MSTQTTVGGTIPEWTRGDLLRKARTSAGMTVKELSTVTGISPKTINNYEGDKVKTRRPTLITWALATGVDLEWILTGHARTPDPEGPGQDGVSNSLLNKVVSFPTSALPSDAAA